MSNKSQGNINKAGQAMAFWAGLLSTLLISPQLWSVSVWLAENVLEPQFGSEIAYYLTFIVMGLICAMMISLSRIFWGTSVGMLIVFALAKLPIM